MADPTRRELLRRLGVFAGGWTAEAAQFVCPGPGLSAEEVRRGLEELHDQGALVLREQRYAWAGERAEDPPDLPEVCRRHRDYYLALAEQGEPELNGPNQGAWLNRLEAERGNFNRALRWCLGQPGEHEAGLRLASALARFWWMRGHAQEGQRWLGAALGQPDGTDALRARALQGAGAVAYARADFASARASYEEALAVLRRLDDRPAQADLLNQLGTVAREQGDYPAARSFHEQGLALYRALDRSWGVAGCLNNLGVVALLEGEPERARWLHQEALEVRRRQGDERGVASSLGNLGAVARALGELAEAAALHEEALAVRRRLGDRWGIAGSLLHLGALACARGDLAGSRRLLGESLELLREVGDGLGLCEWLEAGAGVAAGEGRAAAAARLWACAERAREALGAPLPRFKRAPRASALSALRAALGEPAFAAAWAEGRQLTPEQAVAEL
jgi:tetratricopeptide (TPR) repeat protein